MALCVTEVCVNSLVSVYLVLEVETAASLFNAAIEQLLHDCKSLQTLHILDYGGVYGASIVLDQDHGVSFAKAPHRSAWL